MTKILPVVRIVCDVRFIMYICDIFVTFLVCFCNLCEIFNLKMLKLIYRISLCIL